MEWGYEAPKAGDLIRIKVRFYYHYGIYAAEDTIYQFGLPDNAGIDPERIEVRIGTLAEWLEFGNPETACLSKEEKKLRRPPAETLRIAASRLGERGYNILHNNCEHFANHCIFGEARSSFLDDVRQKIRAKLDKK